MNDLQRVELDILAQFSRVCEAEGLTWFAMFGTLLGAARHGGFIPWDDDIDVAMPRADYNRLCQTLGLFGPPFFLQTPQNDKQAAPRYARLYMDGTTAFPTGFPNAMTRGGHMGASIDILPLDGAPDEDRALAELRIVVRSIQRQMLASAALDEHAGERMPAFKELLCFRYGGIAGSYDALAERYERVCARYDGEKSYAMPVLGGRRGVVRFKKNWFDGAAALDFEGMKVSVPPRWREVLDACYPEGTDEPDGADAPLNKRHFWLVDMRRDYRELLWRYTDMLRGIEDKRIFLFGAGDSLRIWLERYGLRDRVVCTFDNASSKWGKIAYGVPVRAPEALPGEVGEDARLIIVSVWHREIGAQLEGMGITGYYVFVDGWNYQEGAYAG